MLLLYRWSRISKSTGANTFTFHYASTLSWRMSFTLPSVLIYIPLCFYFITACHVAAVPGHKFTFHYASTLSRQRHCKSFTDLSIYIPLCFYFIQKALIEVMYSFKNLHSTMLLLYPSVPLLATLAKITFTFHYASTLSRTIFWPGPPNSYLHSTMLLLYHPAGAARALIDRIYIPLCFYFIACDFSGLVSGTAFTFHYASTLSQGIARLLSWCFHLHSTMLLLYLMRPVNDVSSMSIYIPLCFYFIGHRPGTGRAAG